MGLVVKIYRSQEVQRLQPAQPSSKSSLILSWRILLLNDIRVVTSLILLGSFVHSLGPRYLIECFAVGDCFIPGYREIRLPKIVITIWFFKDVTYICRAQFMLYFIHEGAQVL